MLAGVRDMYRRLEIMRLASRIDLLGAEQKFSDAAHDLATQIEHGGESTANLATLNRQYQVLQADYGHGVQQDLAGAQQKLGEDEAQYRAAAHDVEAMVLRAPVAGIVQQISVHSAHGVVTPAEPLMVVVPDFQPLVVEAMIANRDIGFVRAGQKVKLKVAAFNFTRYGLVSGQVASVSRDTVDNTTRAAQDQEAEAGSGGLKQAVAGEPDLDGGAGSVYVARIALDRETIDVGQHLTGLKPGMSVTAEILTGKRSVISYLLSPILRGTHDAGGER